MVPIIPIESADLAADTPSLHYQCRSILSPVSSYGLEDMRAPEWKDPDGTILQQRMDLSKMPESPKGFGSVGGALEGKLGKHV